MSGRTAFIAEGRPVIRAMMPVTQLEATETVAAKSVVAASTDTRKASTPPKYEFDYSKIDWPAAFREDRLKQQKLEAQSAEDRLRAQFGLESRQTAAVTPAMESGWNKLCAATDRTAQLGQTLFQQIRDAQNQSRREREAELAFMVKHEARS